MILEIKIYRVTINIKINCRLSDTLQNINFNEKNEEL